MLAYVFWHRPRPDAEADAYEAALTGYHRELAEEAVEGFHGSSAHAVAAVPWLEGAPGYEDWYLLEAAWALDSLGEAAITGRLEHPHRRIAALTGAMAAGLYRLVQGEGADGEHATWFNAHDPFPLAGSRLWRRQLVLGPTPEFCLLSDQPAAIAGAIPLTRRRIY